MRFSSAPFLVLSAAFLLIFAPARGEEKEAPVEKPQEEEPSPTETVGKRPWVGIATAPIDYSLRDHLELPEGFGIQVIEVLPESPASSAGLRQNDIITRFEDQNLISPEHLSLLVRTKKAGEKIAFSIIRKGKEEIVELTLGETDEATDPLPRGFGQFSPDHQEDLRRQQDYWQNWMNQNHPEWRGNRSARERNPAENQQVRPHPAPGSRRQEKAPRSGELSPESRPPSISVNPGFPLHVFSSEGTLKIDNEQGELTLTRKGKEHRLELKNVAGEVIYNGPFDPEKGVEGLPQEARDQLEIMKLGNFEVRIPETPQKDPEKTVAPPLEKSGEATPEDGIL